MASKPLPEPPEWLKSIVHKDGTFEGTLSDDATFNNAYFCHFEGKTVCVDADMTPQQLRELADYVEALTT